MRDKGAEMRETVSALASEFLPRGLRVFDHSRGEWPLLAMIEGWEVGSAAEADIVTLLGSAEFSDDLGRELAAWRTQGLPVLCIVCLAADPAAWPFLEPGWRKSYSVEDFDRIAAASGYEVALQIFPATGPGAACLLLPAEAEPSAWWRQPEVATLIQAKAKLGEQQLAKLRRWQASGSKGADWRLYSEQWRRRASIAAAMIPTGLTLLDVGCGAMYLESEAAPRRYIPVDMEAHDERTRVIDLNEKNLPIEWIDEADVVALMGVVEYLDAPEILLKSLASRSKPIIISYSIQEARTEGREAKRNHWRNGYSSDELERLFSALGYAITDSAIFTKRQKIWRLDPATDSGRPALPFGPGREGALPIVHDPAAERREAKTERRELARKSRLEQQADRKTRREARLRILQT
ncbi:methyltransferase domain-containing protein [Zavarzinia aquatilis]|uniref:Uncharacterized protein n=1 Tax=Zavarzinia aquatilis TaxID=2211142 RepID=A0A317E832_9PROT|nr:methyltransferase domain-containing protein [Zavarzinia aquatilis]PWR22841.1 hypothetical protein DKG74_10480 [Zavarzinia aquatilis]